MKKLNEGITANSVKFQLMEYLGEQGYATYRSRFENFKFKITDISDGQPVETACMDSSTGTMCINPGFIEVEKNDPNQLTAHCLAQLSVLCRHELLHYLLAHMHRMMQHAKKLGIADKLMPAWEAQAIQKIDNIAADWDLSREGYSDEDKEIVRNMTLCGRVIGGLILSDDRPDLINLTFEELFDKLLAEHKQNMQKQNQFNGQQPIEINVKEATHSPEYVDVYNKIIAKYGNDTYSDGDIAMLMAAITEGKDIPLD